MSTDQDPTLILTLDNTPSFPPGQVYYEAPAEGTNFHKKTKVTCTHLDVVGKLFYAYLKMVQLLLMIEAVAVAYIWFLR